MFGDKRRAKSKSQRWAEEMERQARDRELIRSKPDAIKLNLTDNGEQGWKWSVWDYDPGQKRLLAGAVEGSIVPHGMKSGFDTMEDARSAGIQAIRKSGWDGLIVLDEPA